MGYFLPQDALQITNLWCSYDGTQRFYLVGSVLQCAECGACFSENPGYGFYTECPPLGEDQRPFKFDVNSGMDWAEFLAKRCRPVPRRAGEVLPGAGVKERSGHPQDGAKIDTVRRRRAEV